MRKVRSRGALLVAPATVAAIVPAASSAVEDVPVDLTDWVDPFIGTAPGCTAP